MPNESQLQDLLSTLTDKSEEIYEAHTERTRNAKKARMRYDFGKEIFKSSLFVGIMWWALSMVEKNQEKQFEQLVTELKSVKQSVGSYIINDDQAIIILRSVVWYHSEGKLNYLERLMIHYDKFLKDNKNQDLIKRIKREIKAGLTQRSKVYVDQLNSYQSKIGLIGNFVWESFPMDKFLNDVYTEFFKVNISISERRRAIASVMLDYQNKSAQLFENKLKKESN